MLVIGCSRNSAFTIAEATNILLSNSRGSTTNLTGQDHVFQWGYLRVLWVADVVVQGSLPRGVTDIPSQQET